MDRRLRPWLVLLVLVLPVAGACQPAPPQPETVLVPMRDGVHLATDLYRPPGDGPWPAVLTRTPYGKQGFGGQAAGVVGQGYVFAVQDMRGRFASEGEDTAFRTDAWGELQDGYDAVEWLAAQSWCTGAVGTMGGSAMGITQYMLAGAAPPHLKCCQVSRAAPSLYHYAGYYGGVLQKAMVEGWLTGNKFRPENLALMKAHPSYDDTWQGMNLAEVADKVTLPMIHQGGWFDCFQGGTIFAYETLQHRGGEGARGNQTLIIDSGTHGGGASRGALEFQPDARRSPFNQTRQWFAHWLKGRGDLPDMPHVYYFALGAVGEAGAPGNEWRTADDWPVPSAPTPAYFHASGDLSFEKPGAADASLSYDYDPADPVPTIGGANLNLSRGSMDQREVEDRADVLLFTSAPLEEPLEVTGHVTVNLWVSSDAPDTDFTAKLTDVYPDGRSFLVCDGIRRVRYRNSFERPEFLPPGEVAQVSIDLWSTSIVFNQGHRLRVAVSSSNLPRFSANPNTGAPTDEGDETRVAHNTVYVGRERASHIVLPVVRL
jgi:predicted acyl esterase